ncbi:Protein of unknown function DUF2292 [Syntrophobotulus glycolicus DSM 8271]|uniref:DUF2292 domain-containing protein n=1 Tax=Syntrophobotulus glycolicus (strain DSM 8271 / FlGlyR) TaxID=645991 RepID=F0SYG3_SYNGF|nr:YezD family protein [Syntrophobotulus glycolicus]ADY57075.1 Protein of unknown function DUF2292 [Syntrophobotulus glycolicus DSM 8271]
MVDNKKSGDSSQNPISDEYIEKLVTLLKTIKFGSITLIIQNGEVVQLEKNEKMRIK